MLNDYRTIVVGTDGSALAGPTVARAARLAAHDGADLVIVCAYAGLTRRQTARGALPLGDPPATGQVPGGRAAADEVIAVAVAVAQEQHATVTAALVADGEPATALLTEARDRDADLVVIGARRDAGLAERLLGSVATEVVRQAACEVLIVRPRTTA